MPAASRPFIALAVLALAACGPDAETEQRLARLYALTAEKDSLLVQLSENARLMSEIGAEIARVQAPTVGGPPETPIAVTREGLLSDIRALTTRLQETEARLAESEARVAALAQDDTDNSVFEKTIADLRQTVANQKRTIASLTSQVQALRQENTRLAEANVGLTEEKEALSEENLALADTLSRLADEVSMVYYTVGSREQLIEQGVVDEEGGSRVLFVFGKRGKTLVPARDLDPARFVMVDRRTFSELPLEPGREYTIVSRQDFGALEPPPDEEGRVTAPVRIADPDRFWAGGRYLIVVER